MNSQLECKWIEYEHWTHMLWNLAYLYSFKKINELSYFRENAVSDKLEVTFPHLPFYSLFPMIL